MSLADVIQMPRMFQRDIRQIEGRAVEVVQSEYDQEIEHIKRLRKIAEDAEKAATAKRAESLEATRQAAEYKKDYEEAQAEFAARLKSEGVI